MWTDRGSGGFKRFRQSIIVPETIESAFAIMTKIILMMPKMFSTCVISSAVSSVMSASWKQNARSAPIEQITRYMAQKR
jgi:hypothetical protein